VSIAQAPRRLAVSETDRWLLGAALQAGDEGWADWERWLGQCRVDTAGPGPQSLFGMVYANLGKRVEEPQLPVLKGVYKRHWYANQVALARTRDLLLALEERHVSSLMLNDLALITAYYPDRGCRPISCIDLLVPRAQRADADNVALAGGWELRPQQSFGSPRGLSIALFKRPDRGVLRIWSGLFAAEPLEETEARCWEAARRVPLEGIEALAAGPVDLLLAAAGEAYRADSVPLYRYADTMRLLEFIESDADWSELVWRAQRYQHVLPLRNLLAGTCAAYAKDPPAWVLPELRRMAIAWSELLQFSRACDTPGLRLKSAGLRLARRLLPGLRDAG